MKSKSHNDAVSVLAIREILRRYPDLGPGGFWPDNRGCLIEAIAWKNFNEDRLRMTSAECVREYAFAMNFLRGRPSRKSFSGLTSYGLKHSAERWCRWETGEHVYVSNGMFIVAALVSGFEIKRLPCSRNCLVNLSLCGLNGIWQIEGGSIYPAKSFLGAVLGGKTR
jgi:hypothetical protein